MGSHNDMNDTIKPHGCVFQTSMDWKVPFFGHRNQVGNQLVTGSTTGFYAHEIRNLLDFG